MLNFLKVSHVAGLIFEENEKNNDICILNALADDNKRNSAGDYRRVFGV
jgi:hypothetical protein